MRFRRGETARLAMLKDLRNAPYLGNTCTIEVMTTGPHGVPIYGVTMHAPAARKFAVADYQLQKLTVPAEPQVMRRQPTSEGN